MNKCILLIVIMNSRLFIKVLMKKILCLIGVFLLTACTQQVKEEYVEPVHPVNAQVLELEEHFEYVKYAGILQPEKMVQKTFSNIGEVTNIYVKEGQKIKVGQLLAKQNTDNLESTKSELAIQLESDKANEEAARQQMIADEATYKDSLVNGTSVEQQVADAQFQASTASYEAAQQQTQLTQTTLDNIDTQIHGSYLYSNIDGYVLMMNAEVGETANPLIPVMVLGTSNTVVTIGLSQDNVRKVQTGMVASVKIGELEYEGKVLNINRIPDTASRTYETDIKFPVDLLDFFIGETAVVNINVGTKEGIWIPIKVIQNDGEDYVYVILDNRAKKKIITPINIDNDYVLVEGLQAGDQIIIDGMKNVKAGSLVEVINS